MNDHPFRNILKILFCYAVHSLGLTRLLIKLYGRAGLLVVNYHDFTTFRNDYWRCGKIRESGYGARFERQVEFIETHFRLAQDEDLIRPGNGVGACLMTFDDGYRDNYSIALDVLSRHHVSSIFFIATGATGKSGMLWIDRVRSGYSRVTPKNWRGGILVKRAAKKWLAAEKARSQGRRLHFMGRAEPDSDVRMMMNWEELSDALGRGVRIGAHTRNHPILSRLEEVEQRAEIEGALHDIEQHLGFRPHYFAYPEGTPDSFNSGTVGILKSLGIRAAFTTISGVNRKGADPLCLRRVGVNPSDPIAVMATKIAFSLMRHKPGPERNLRFQPEVEDALGVNR